MNEIKLTIGGRDHIVACAPGEEDRLVLLSEEINKKLAQLGGNLSPSDVQNLLFASLFLADDLFETRKNAAEAETRFDKKLAETADAQAAATRAVEENDALKLQLSKLEGELEDLQSAQKLQSAELERVRAELEQHQKDAESAAQASADLTEQLTGQLTELKRERDSLTTQMANKDILLQQADSMIRSNVSADQADQEASEANPSTGPSTGISNDPNLAPALERFADMLENCADNLEGCEQTP